MTTCPDRDDRDVKYTVGVASVHSIVDIFNQRLREGGGEQHAHPEIHLQKWRDGWSSDFLRVRPTTGLYLTQHVVVIVGEAHARSSSSTEWHPTVVVLARRSVAMEGCYVADFRQVDELPSLLAG